MIASLAPRVTIGVLGLIVASAIGVSIARAAAPPEITLQSPAMGETVREPAVLLKGAARGARRIALNGVELPFDGTTGAFEETIPLKPGATLLRVSAKRRHSRERVVERRVIYEPQ